MINGELLMDVAVFVSHKNYKYSIQHWNTAGFLRL